MKINKNTIIRGAIVIVATVLIVSTGIGVPGLLIRNMTTSKKLPSGSVDIASVQPYGADIINRKTDFLNAVVAYHERSRSSSINLRSVYRSNGFADIGIQNQADGLGSGREEFMAGAYRVINDYFPGALPVSYYARDFRAGTYEFTEVFNDTSHAEFDRITGLPVDMSFVLCSVNDCNPGNICADMVNLYADYIGITFPEASVGETYNDGYKDSMYECIYTSSDGDFVINCYVTSGWYFTPPSNPYGEWEPTDMYEWTFNFYVLRIR